MTQQRGGGAARSPIDPQELEGPERGAHLVALDEALVQLADVDERQAQIVELKYFGGQLFSSL